MTLAALFVGAAFALRAAHAAHPVSVTRTYAYVAPELLSAKMQVFLEDLFLFHKLKPNDQDFLEPDDIRRGIELHKEFLRERFVVRDVGGRRIPGKVVDVKVFDMPAEGIALGALMSHTLTFELQYEIPAEPEFLVFSQHFTDEEVIFPSEMKLNVKQESGDEPEVYELRPGDQQIVRFNWDTPALSPEASAAEREKWVEQQKEQTLGITSYSSVYSFLYIEDFEVRHEILIPLLTLEESVLIARDDDDFLDLAEQQAARAQIEAYFKSGNPVEIDGKRIEPVVDRCDFFGLDFKDFARRAEPKKVSLATARVGIILRYPTGGPPDTVQLTWNRFNEYVWAVNLVVFAFEETSKQTLSRIGMKNVFRWENPGRSAPSPPEPVKATSDAPATVSLPVVSVSCVLLAPLVLIALKLKGVGLKTIGGVAGLFLVGAAAGWPWLRYETPNPLTRERSISDERAREVFAALQRNVYRAFDYREESDVYDALAVSVDGPLLEDLYLRIRKSLEMQEQGGAVSRIQTVEIVEGEKRPPETTTEQGDAFAYRCRWNVSGTVEHWGHIHARTNQYVALFEIQAREGAWKITGMELLDEERIKFETNVRSL